MRADAADDRSMGATELHARAVARFEEGAAAEAVDLLREAVAEQLHAPT